MDTTGTDQRLGATGHPGHLMDGKSAVSRAVTIRIEVDTIQVADAVDGAEVVRWPFTGARAEAVPDGSALEVRHASQPDALLTAAGRDLADSLSAAGLRVSGFPQGHRLATRLLVHAGGVIALVALGFWALPRVATAIAHRVPLSVEQSLGAQVDALFEKDYCESPEVTRALLGLQQRIEGQSAAPRDLRILDLTLPNAFTFPGGRIVVTRGLLRDAEGPDELAGVLAHEIQHVEQRHIMAQVIRGVILSAAWAVTVGDFTGVLVVDPTTAFQIATLRFSRADEESADRRAVAMLDAAGIPRDGLIRFFERLKEKTDQVPEWLSSHPTSARRVQELAPGTDASARGGPGAEIMPAPLWETLKNACAHRPEDPERSLGKILFGG